MSLTNRKSLKTLGPNVKPRSITVSKLETSDIESPPKKRKHDSELNQKIVAALEENRKLSEPSLKLDHAKFIAKSCYMSQDLDFVRKELSCKTISHNNKLNIMH